MRSLPDAGKLRSFSISAAGKQAPNALGLAFDPAGDDELFPDPLAVQPDSMIDRSRASTKTGEARIAELDIPVKERIIERDQGRTDRAFLRGFYGELQFWSETRRGRRWRSRFAGAARAASRRCRPAIASGYSG